MGFLILGILSGLLLVFAWPPFSAPIFSLFALAPLVFLASKKTPLPFWQLFAGGFVAGAIAWGTLSYSVFHAFAWPPDDQAILALIHWSFILWGLVVGCIVGTGLVLYRKIRFHSPLLNAALFASMYIGLEQALQFVTGHYYIGALAYTVTFLHVPFTLASLGGELFVSFTVAFISALVGEFFALEQSRRTQVLWQAAALCAGVGIVCAANAYYLYGTGVGTQSLRVAAIQTGNRDDIAFANEHDGALSFPALAKKLNDEAQNGSALIIYPLAVVNEALSIDTAPSQGYGGLRFIPRTTLEGWMAANAPASSTVVTWDITYQNGDYLQNYDFWSGGRLASVYSKRKPYAFTEYTPSFTHFGFGPTPAPISPSRNSGLVELAGGITASSLQCSEIHLASLARSDSKNAQVFLAIGLEWIFPGSVGEEYSLKAAQYRAAENNIPAVRSTAEGPSALINARGAITDRLYFNEDSTLRGTLTLEPNHRTTLYTILGDYPLYIGAASIFIFAIVRRRKEIIFPGTRG